MNDPQFTPVVHTFALVYEYCDDAARLLNYTDPNCETDHTVTDQTLADMVIYSRVVSQYFNPQEYSDSKEMNYASQLSSVDSYLPGNNTVNRRYELQQQNFIFYGFPWIDLSNLGVNNFGHQEIFYDPEPLQYSTFQRSCKFSKI